MEHNSLEEKLESWQVVVRRYQKPDTRKAVIQILNTFLPFFGLWFLVYYSLNWSYILTLLFAAITGLFMIRIFVIQHDCGHQSFLKSRKWNNAVGFFSSFFSSIPYDYWSRIHNMHHAHNRQFEYRGLGDIHFLTTEEYTNRSRFGKLGYRVLRNAFVQFLIIPIVYFYITLRVPFVHLKRWKVIRWPHLINNLMLVAVYTTMAMILGWQTFLLVHVPILYFFTIVSFWLFYVQHQHEHSYAESEDDWNHLIASIKGSTYYKLPRLFQWLSGNIGFHHIHHLNSSIPNYNLEVCSKENPLLNKYVSILNFRQSLKCIHHKLWDEQTQRMITFKEYSRKH